MANYCCAVRTNYFRVKDPDKFTEFMKDVVAYEDQVEVWSKEQGDQTFFGFGCYSPIAGVRDKSKVVNNCEDDDEETSYDDFIRGLQELLEDGDAVIIFESGNEKLRYVVGEALIVTNDDFKFISIDDIAVSTAGKMLGSRDYSTVCSY